MSYDDSPVRVQRSRQAGWKAPPDTIYVGRGSKWGNKNRIGDLDEDGVPLSRFECVHRYVAWILADGRLEEARRELKGKNLMCWCRLDQLCHADTLLILVNSEALAEYQGFGTARV